MAITRADLLKELLPGLNALFDLEYSKHSDEIFSDKDYIVEVDFGHERTTQAVSNSEGSSADVSK